MVVLLLAPLAGERTASADSSCLLLVCTRTSQAAPPPTPTPNSQITILGLQLPPCLVCTSLPLISPICGVTADCRPTPAAAPAGSPAVSAGPAAGATAAPTPATRRSPPPPPAQAQTTPAPAPGSPQAPSPGDLLLAPPVIAELSPASGLSFGGAPALLPVFAGLDVAALIALAAVLRRSWSRKPGA